MVAHFTIRTNGVNKAFRFVEGIWLHRKSRQIRLFLEETYFTSYVRNMFWDTFSYKYHVIYVGSEGVDNAHQFGPTARALFLGRDRISGLRPDILRMMDIKEAADILPDVGCYKGQILDVKKARYPAGF